MRGSRWLQGAANFGPLNAHANQEITEEAHIAFGSFYNHFDSNEPRARG